MRIMQGLTTVTAEPSDGPLRDQLTSVLSLLVLSIRMTESRDEGQILELATTSVPALVRCRMHGVHLGPPGWVLTSATLAAAEARAGLEAQFAALSDAGGAVSIPAEPWAWAFSLRSLGGHLGHLVIGADDEPSSHDQFLLRVLAQQIAIALANARLHHRELAAAAELRAANAQLEDSVSAIRRRSEIHERLTRAAMTGTGLAGIAEAVHDLTGHPIVVEDRSGNVIARAGGDETGGAPRESRAARERIIQRAIEAGAPIREQGRIVVIASPHDEVAGVMVLMDPDGTAGEPEIVALEHGATVAAMELTRLRSLGETRLRLGRDLLEDLLAGADPQAAVERARAIGCDLLEPRRVAVISELGADADDDRRFEAVRRALRDHAMGSLLTTRAGTVIVLADATSDWAAVRAAVVRTLAGDCRIGIGGSVTNPADIPRSYREAQLALRLVKASDRPSSVTAFDDLGVFRLLAGADDTGSVERFVSEWLGTLLEYDARKPAELVPTLSRFLEAGQGYEATSDALAIHRSTLKYRLQRIREISGHDLSDADTRFNLQLATRAWQTLGALNGAGTGDAKGR
jgi:sugar diacid utilization regulator